MQELKISTNNRNELIDITHQVQQIIKKQDVVKGMCIVYCPHTTAAITINENADPSVQRDILMQLRKMVPQDAEYQHSEGNSDAHLKASMMGFSQTVLIENGQLVLGTWQGIYFCEFDGPRSRKIFVKIFRD